MQVDARPSLFGATSRPAAQPIAAERAEAPALPLLLAAFLACLAVCATLFQVRSTTPPWQDGAPIEYFTGALLWQLSLVALLMAAGKRLLGIAFLAWMAASAGLAGLAIDEIFAFHERSGAVAGDDDLLKVGLWLASGVALLLVQRSERLPRPYSTALLLGFAIQSVYIAVELGDGDLFTMPLVSTVQLLWIEEFLELGFLSAYLFGFAGLLRRSVPRSG